MNMSILVLKCGLNDTCIFLLVNLVRRTYLIIYRIEQKFDHFDQNDQWFLLKLNN
jgi:hypothetical protein